MFFILNKISKLLMAWQIIWRIAFTKRIKLILSILRISLIASETYLVRII